MVTLFRKAVYLWEDPEAEETAAASAEEAAGLTAASAAEAEEAADFPEATTPEAEAEVAASAEGVLPARASTAEGVPLVRASVAAASGRYS